MSKSRHCPSSASSSAVTLKANRTCPTLRSRGINGQVLVSTMRPARRAASVSSDLNVTSGWNLAVSPSWSLSDSSGRGADCFSHLCISSAAELPPRTFFISGTIMSQKCFKFKVNNTLVLAGTDGPCCLQRSRNRGFSQRQDMPLQNCLVCFGCLQL